MDKYKCNIDEYAFLSSVKKEYSLCMLKVVIYFIFLKIHTKVYLNSFCTYLNRVWFIVYFSGTTLLHESKYTETQLSADT